MSKKSDPQISKRFYIGGGNIGKLLGLHPTEGPLDVYNELLGITPQVQQDALMEKGLELEPIAAKKYERETGRKLRKVAELVHPEFSFIRGNIDRELVDTEEPWEAKCPVSRRFGRWKNEGLPQTLIGQLHLYMGLKKSDGGVWSILNSDLWQTANFHHDADPASYQIMIEVAVSFWQDHVEKRIPPAEGIPDNPLVEFETVKGQMIRIETPEFLSAMALLRDAKRHVKQAGNLEDMARERVKSALGDRKGKYISSVGKLYWTDQAGRSTFDHKRLAQVVPLDRQKVTEVLEQSLGTAQFKNVMKALRTCDLDLEQFFKVGEPFEMLRPYFSNSEDEDDD